MDKQESRIDILLEKYEQGLATEQEVRELEVWYQTFEDSSDIMENLSESKMIMLRETMWDNITAKLSDQYNDSPVKNKPSIIFRPLWTAMASMLFFATIGVWILMKRPSPVRSPSSVLSENFAPGSNKAVLTLAGGEQIILTNAKNGQLATQGGSVISKIADGKLVYNAGQSKDQALRNTVSTPGGGQYSLVLADGTSVWLNAASSISYPSVFTGMQRQVEVTGEVYFEVAHNRAKPFIVQCGAQTIEVLGTHFNVNAYTNEGNIRTTLLEGAVAVSVAGNHCTLSPGQQAVLKDNSIKVRAVNINEVVAWKDGYFQFEAADIQTVMRQISRWYNVEIIFEGPITRQTFTGRISRNRNISNVLKIVQSYKDVQLTFDERRIMVK